MGFFEAGEHLNKVYGHSEHVFGGDNDLFVFFSVVAELPFEVHLATGKTEFALLKGHKPWNFNSLRECFVLLLDILC